MKKWVVESLLVALLACIIFVTVLLISAQGSHCCGPWNSQRSLFNTVNGWNLALFWYSSSAIEKAPAVRVRDFSNEKLAPRAPGNPKPGWLISRLLEYHKSDAGNIGSKPQHFTARLESIFCALVISDTVAGGNSPVIQAIEAADNGFLPIFELWFHGFCPAGLPVE